jgi:hypothetical protein
MISVSSEPNQSQISSEPNQYQMIVYAPSTDDQR